MTSPPHRSPPRTASMRLVTALLAALVLTLISSCSTSPQQQQTGLPDGTRLLADSAAAMRTVKSVHFTIAAQGDTPGISLRYADGQLTQEGSAKGTAKVDQGGKLVDQEFVIIGNTLYLRGPAGDYQKLPSSVAGAVYDPSVILNPDRGIAAVLASAKDAKTEAREPIAGVDSYRVSATFPKDSLGKLLPGISKDTTGQVWLAVQGLRLVEAQFRVGNGLVSAHFTDYDTPVAINSPV
jgi:lipoprotein LprG